MWINMNIGMLINYKTVNINREIAVLMTAVHTDTITTKGLFLDEITLFLKGRFKTKYTLIKGKD